MQNDLLNDLLNKPQRETAGSDTASRFDYQKNWAFCQMLKRHMAGANYLVAFEFHDDVVFMEPSPVPTTAEFYQVKTTGSTKPRTLTSLTSRRKDANSILGKMCLNFDGICASHNTKVILVSNTAFEFSNQDICADALEPKYRKRIITKLTEEIPSLIEAHLAKMHFMVSGVSIDAMHSYLQGEVMELFKTRLGEDHGVNVHSWIRLVQGEITRKNNFPSEKIGSAAQLIEKKCIDKLFIDKSIECVSKNRTIPLDMTLINSELKDAGWDFQTLMRIGKQLPTAMSDHSDPTNHDVTDLVARMNVSLDEQNAELPALSLFLQEIKASLAKPSSALNPYTDENYLLALAILVYHEKV